jgi:hypothetical protein
MALGGGRGGMSAGAGRGILLPLIVLLSLLYILIACLSGYLFNRQADGKSILGEYYSCGGRDSAEELFEKLIEKLLLPVSMAPSGCDREEVQ